MASTFSPTLRLELIGDGDQSGIWGQTTNSNLGTLLEQAITGVITIDLSGYSDYTLTNYNGLSDEARNAVLVFTGTPNNTCTVNVPSVNKTYIVVNKTTGSNAVVIQTTTANTSNTGSGTFGTDVFVLVTAATDGTRVDGVRFRNAGTSAFNASAPTRFCIFLTDTTGSIATNKLIGEVAQAAGTTRSATQIGATSIFTFDQPIIMLSGQVMSVTSTNWASAGADNTVALAYAGDY